jgi:hypothetical protein
VPEQIDTQQLAQDLVARARAEGVDLVGPGGLLVCEEMLEWQTGRLTTCPSRILTTIASMKMTG